MYLDYKLPVAIRINRRFFLEEMSANQRFRAEIIPVTIDAIDFTRATRASRCWGLRIPGNVGRWIVAFIDRVRQRSSSWFRN